VKENSGGEPPQSKTWRKFGAFGKCGASWSAPALPPLRRAIAPFRRDGGWRFENGTNERPRALLFGMDDN